MNYIIKYWDKVSNLGVNPIQEESLIVRLRFINKIMMMTIIVSLIVLPIIPKTFYWFSLGTIALYVVGLWLTKKVTPKISMSYFLLTSTLLLVVGLMALGEASSFLIFTFPLITIIYFVLKKEMSWLHNGLFLLGLFGLLYYSLGSRILFDPGSSEFALGTVMLIGVVVQMGILNIFKAEEGLKDRALLEKQSSLEEAQRVAQVGNWEYSYHTEQLQFSNQMRTMFNIPKEKTLDFDSDFVKLLPSDYQIILKSAKNERNINKYLNFSFAVEINGKKEWFHIIGRKSFDQDKKAIRLFGTVQNVTEQVEKDEEVTLASSFAEAALEATADGIVIEDAQHRVTRHNKMFTELWRIRSSEIKNKTRAELDEMLLNELKNPEDFLETIKALESNPKVTSLDTLYFKDGRTFERYSYPQIVDEEEVGRVWSFRDITDQCRAESALRNNEATLRSIIESTTDRIYAVNKQYRLVAFNKIFENAYKEMHEEELYLGMNMVNQGAMHNEKRYFDRALSGENVFHEYQLEADAASAAYFMTSYNPIKNEEGEVIGCTVFSKDITEEKKAQRELKLNEAKMRSIFDSTTDEVYAIDKDYRLIAFNKTSSRNSKRLNGVELNLNKNFLSTRNGKSWKRYLEKALQGDTFTQEHHFKPNSFYESYFLNSYAPIKDQYGMVTGCTVFSKDITTLKQTKQAIVESQQRFDSIFRNEQVGVIVIGRDGRIKDVNKAFCAMSQYNDKELKQANLENLILPVDIQLYKEHLNKLVKKQLPTITLQTRYNRFDGDILYTETNLSGIYDEQEQFLGCTVTVTNLSDELKKEEKIRELIKELKMQSEDLRASNNELNQSTKELEQFAYIASHDLQEPLRMIGNFVELLGDEYQEQFDEDGKTYMKYIVSGVSRMSALIEAILQFSRMTKKEPVFKKVSIETLVKESLSQLKDRTLNAQINLEGLNIELNVEGNQLGKVFLNLIDNALKFNKSSVSIIEIKAKERPNDWVFSVSDNGIGIDNKYQDKIFEIFKRLHRKEDYEGTGIGLALCKRIIHRHKGIIWYNSSLGKGSTFYFSVNKNLGNE